MSEKGLSEWFTKRRESNAAKHIRAHVTKVMDTVVSLDKAFAAAMEDQRGAVLDALRTLYLDEKATDNLEVILFEDLSKGDLDASQREALMRLVRQIDNVSDQVQQAGLNLELLMESRKTVPREFWKLYRDLSASLVEETRALRAAVEAFGRDHSQVLKHREEVKHLEQRIDDSYFQLRKKLISSSSHPLALLVLSDILASVEMAADRANDAADMLFILVMANR